jgi:hypothetical protein
VFWRRDAFVAYIRRKHDDGVAPPCLFENGPPANGDINSWETAPALFPHFRSKRMAAAGRVAVSVSLPGCPVLAPSARGQLDAVERRGRLER